MNSLKLALLALFSLAMVLGGCAGPPPAKDLANADFGAPVSQGEAERQAKVWLDRNLKDPDSARTEWEPVAKVWAKRGLIQGGGYGYGYALIGTVNARNSFGGYTGREPFVFMFRDAKLVGGGGQRSAGFPVNGRGEWWGTVP